MVNLEEFNNYFNTGKEIIKVINSSKNQDPVGKSATENNLRNFLSVFRDEQGRPLDLSGVDLEGLVNYSKDILGSVYSPIVFKGLPDYLRNLYESISQNLPAIDTYKAIVPTVENFGKKYNVQGDIDKNIKEKLNEYYQTLDQILQGKGPEDVVKEIAKDISKSYLKSLLKGIPKDGLTKKEQEDYMAAIAKIIVENKDKLGIVRALARSYRNTGEKEFKANKENIINYITSIAKKVYNENLSIKEKYERFVELGKTTDALNKEIEKAFKNYQALRENGFVED